MILVFDLDDTLYDELTYVKSGLRAVAGYLGANYNLSAKKIDAELLNALQKYGRGKVFDAVLENNKMYSRRRVKECLAVYRAHKPSIKLSKEGRLCLDRFKNLSKYLVTDGNKIVQLNKIKALGITPYFKKMFRTYQYGLKYSKPSTFCFHKICGLEKVDPSSVVYIADNPHKDFINLKKEGFKTIRLRGGMFKDVTLNNEHEAHVTVNSLSEITPGFLTSLFKKK